ncbi:transglutaminase-like domain-containing protein [Nakamurella lactea]|uniref:transglutaminase-like domain-containing protein n=1 Tax=Nakamurella lactea TaxID=459515 RepID=UPI00049172D3|nr:transglutaminase-like domain-containing protein [Nakamurella lactea]
MRDRLPVGRMLVDATAIAVLVAGAGLAFGPAYGGSRFLLALGLGALVGGLAALIPALARWPAVLTLPLAAVGYLLVGGAAAVPRSTVGGVLPSGESIRLLSVGVITSWKQMLTVAVPVGSAGSLLLPAFLTSLVLTAAGVSVALRSARPLTALLAPALMAAGAALLGTGSAFHPAIAGTALALAALLWAGSRRRADGRPGLDLRRPLALVALLIPAVAAGVFLGPGLLPDAQARTTVRELVEPPFDPSTLPSPLSGYRSYVKLQTKQVLFTVDGLPAGVPLRLATLDAWDGRIYSASADSGVFTRVGDRLASVPAGERADLTVTVGDYHDVWAPTAGYLAAVEFSGADADRLREGFRYNRQTGAALVTSMLTEGNSYHLEVSVPTQPTVAELAGASVDDSAPMGDISDAVPAEVKTKADEWTAGAKDEIGIIEAIRKHLHDDGWLSHGDNWKGVPGGHGADRIRRLLTAKYMFGDAEQYSVAMALMLRSKGIPARVVMGFAGRDTAGTTAFTGSQMTAWVEVPFTGAGWVSFDPLPQEGKDLPAPSDDPEAQGAAPKQRQPPPPPIPPKDADQNEAQSPPDQQPKEPDQNTPRDDENPSPVAVPWGWIGAGTGAGLLVLLPIGAILLLKSRRKKRHGAGSPDQRIAGAWSHLMDTAADFGRRPNAGTTRAEAAEQLAAAFAPPPAGVAGLSQPGVAGLSQGPPVAPAPGVLVLARRADAVVFAPDPVDPQQADRYWADMESQLASIKNTQSGWRRFRARLSLASLRKRT